MEVIENKLDARRHADAVENLEQIISDYVASPPEREGIVVVAGLRADGSLANLEVRPVRLADSGFAEAPSPESARAILDHFRDLTHEITDGTSARHFYDDISSCVVPLYARDLRAAYRQSGVLGLARKARRIRVRHVRRLLHGFVP